MNGRDGQILSMVNIGRAGENNAFFYPSPFGPEGTGVVAFGAWDDGTPLVSADIVAHEVMHGVTHFSVSRRTGDGLLNNAWGHLGPTAFTLAGRTFRCGESLVFRTGPDANRAFRFACEDDRFLLLANHGGAAKEAFSDILGTAVEFSVHAPGAGPLRADYVTGEDTGPPIRSLENPRSLSLGNSSIPYPDAYSRLVRFIVGIFEDNGRFFFSNIGSVDGRTIVSLPGDDRGGVHWNSTILSHAFYLAIEGGRNETTGRTVQGVGTANRHQVERVFFRAMTALMPSQTNFQITDAVIRQSAVDLFGVGSATQRARSASRPARPTSTTRRFSPRRSTSSGGVAISTASKAGSSRPAFPGSRPSTSSTSPSSRRSTARSSANWRA